MKTYRELNEASASTLMAQCAVSALSILSNEIARLAKRSLKPTAAGNRRHYDSLKTVMQAQAQAERIIASENPSLASLLKDENVSGS